VPRPFIHVNFAAAAAAADPSACVSCDADWRRVHRLRERYDAVAVGARTWNIDHPRLTVRPERLGREPRRQPAKAVFAGSHHCEIAGGASGLFVIGSECAYDGATFIRTTGHQLARPLEALYEHGIRSMLVEGGPTILHSFFTQQLADAVTVFVRAGSAEAAHRAAVRTLPSLPLPLTARRFGEGFLLSGRMTAVESRS
jgi:2,5-diamino-6-(ribosylamino)-4(3H)-pyrimidinone 5'-phosphate reductase